MPEPKIGRMVFVQNPLRAVRELGVSLTSNDVSDFIPYPPGAYEQPWPGRVERKRKRRKRGKRQ
jgi:hypothetical protein